jgi:hypothetical protein
MPEQTNLFVWNNQNLFSNNYLEYHLPTSSLWKEHEEKAITAFEQIKNLYEATKPLNFGPGLEHNSR